MESQISSLNEAIHWGEGFFFGNRQGSAYTTNYEIGYMYSLRRSPLPPSRGPTSENVMGTGSVSASGINPSNVRS